MLPNVFGAQNVKIYTLAKFLSCKCPSVLMWMVLAQFSVLNIQYQYK